MLKTAVSCARQQRPRSTLQSDEEKCFETQSASGGGQQAMMRGAQGRPGSDRRQARRSSYRSRTLSSSQRQRRCASKQASAHTQHDPRTSNATLWAERPRSRCAGKRMRRERVRRVRQQLSSRLRGVARGESANSRVDPRSRARRSRRRATAPAMIGRSAGPPLMELSLVAIRVDTCRACIDPICVSGLHRRRPSACDTLGGTAEQRQPQAA